MEILKSPRAFVCLVALFVLNSCGPINSGAIFIPLRVCVVRGSSLTLKPLGQRASSSLDDPNNYIVNGTQSVDDFVYTAVEDLNAKVWRDGANITFSPQSHALPNGRIPIIDDPFPPGSDQTKNGPGRFGDISRPNNLDPQPGTEAYTAYQACQKAWADAPQVGGRFVIVARDIVGPLGVPTNDLGFGPSHAETLFRNNGNDFCVFPRHLLQQDLIDKYVIIVDPVQMNAKSGVFYHVLAHELGHTLLLGHGDGLDNDQNGLLPPAAGPRKFDVDCDGPEFVKFDSADTAKTHSIMDVAGAVSNTITPLQKELVRDAAVLVPGAIVNQ